MIEFLLNTALYLIPILIILGVVVTIHELGHFLAAKSVGVAVDQFSIGFGKPLYAWKDKAGVEWRLGSIPLGGYVRFSGDENAASVPDGEDLATLRQKVLAREGPAALNRYFHFKPLWARAFVVAAGPAANFILALIVLTGLLTLVGEPFKTPRVDVVAPGSPAQQAGFRPGDVIRQADTWRIDNFFDLQRIIMLRSGTPTTFVVDRGGLEVDLVATPRRGVVKDALGREQRLGVLGIESRGLPGEKTWITYGPWDGGARAVQTIKMQVHTTVAYVGRIFTGREKGDQLSGPIGMAHVSGDIAKLTVKESPDARSLLLTSLIRMAYMIAGISVGVGFINLMPIPVLDGGHLLFYAYEAVARRPLAAKVQAAGYRVGLALVLGLMLFATWNDLQRLPVFKTLGGLFT